MASKINYYLRPSNLTDVWTYFHCLYQFASELVSHVLTFYCFYQIQKQVSLNGKGNTPLWVTLQCAFITCIKYSRLGNEVPDQLTFPYVHEKTVFFEP